MKTSVLKKALLVSAFLLFPAAIQAADESCDAERIDVHATVAHVYDGDTVRLRNGDKVRIIGINTPELGRDGKPSQPFSRKAQQRLETLLRRHDNRIELRYGAERRDRYRRILAHAYLPDGRNLGALLLRDGLAARVTVPPNTYALPCYQHAETGARKSDRGIWSLANDGVVRVVDLKAGARGFHILRGTVSSIDKHRNNTTITLNNRLELRVDKRDYDYFEPGFAQRLRGKSLQVRGWISGGSGALRMRLRHPAELVVK